MGTSAKR